MSQYSGAIFSGEFDQSNDSFYLTEVKNLHTGSVLSVKQLSNLYNYLNKQSDNCMITVNDQLPVILQKNEIAKLKEDIESIVQSIETSGMEGRMTDA